MLVVSLLTALILIYIGIGVEILVLDGPLSLLVVIGGLAAIFLVLALIPALPYLIAKIALWPTRVPNNYGTSMSRKINTLPTSDAPPAESTPLLHERWLLPWTVSRMLVYAGEVSAILVLGFLVFKHARPNTIPDVEIYATFGAEGVYFVALLTYMLIKRKRAALRTS